MMNNIFKTGWGGGGEEGEREEGGEEGGRGGGRGREGMGVE